VLSLIRWGEEEFVTPYTQWIIENQRKQNRALVVLTLILIISLVVMTFLCFQFKRGWEDAINENSGVLSLLEIQQNAIQDDITRVKFRQREDYTERINNLAGIILDYNPGLGGEAVLIAMAYDSASQYYAIPLDKLMGIGKVESHYRRTAVSSEGAVGLQQIMPSTMKTIAQQMDLKTYELTDILTNVCASAYHLNDIGFNAFPNEALTIYNKGNTKSLDRMLTDRNSYLNKVSRAAEDILERLQ
jgi:hypothetical protein